MRRGLGLSAAFLLTALSQGRVFAEIVPSELVSSTVRLAQKFGPRRAGLSLHSPESADTPRVELPARLARLGRSRGDNSARGRRFLSWLLLSILVVSMSVGVGLAATNSGGFAGLRSAAFVARSCRACWRQLRPATRARNRQAHARRIARCATGMPNETSPRAASSRVEPGGGRSLRAYLSVAQII